MTVLGLLTILAIYIIIKRPEELSRNALPDNISVKIDKLRLIAQEALIDKKYLRAEKALLTILRFDERNAQAYNRLGIIYATQKNFKEAIECFEIVQSLENNPSSLHNVGLIYLETKNYEQAALAFEQALRIEDNLPTRYRAYATALENLNREKEAISALEKAVELDSRPQALRHLGALYLKVGQQDKALEIKQRLDQLKKNRKAINQNRIEAKALVKKV